MDAHASSHESRLPTLCTEYPHVGIQVGRREYVQCHTALHSGYYLRDDAMGGAKVDQMDCQFEMSAFMLNAYIQLFLLEEKFPERPTSKNLR